MRWMPGAALTAILSLCATTAGAAELAVTSLEDSGDGTLRDAIQRADATPDPDTITIDVDGVIRLTTTLPAVSTSISVVGHGWERTIIEGAPATDDRPAVRPFVISAGGSLLLDGVMVRSSIPAAEGGAVLNDGGTFTYRDSTRPPANLGYGGVPRFQHEVVRPEGG